MPNAGDDDASLQGATGPVRESMQLTDSVVFNCAWQASGQNKRARLHKVQNRHLKRLLCQYHRPQIFVHIKASNLRKISFWCGGKVTKRQRLKVHRLQYRGYMYIDKHGHASFSRFGLICRNIEASWYKKRSWNNVI